MSAFDELLAYVTERGAGASEAINPFWRHELRKLQALLEQDRRPSIDEVVRALGYFDDRLPSGMTNRDTEAWGALMKALESDPCDRALAEHAGSLAVLMKHKLLEAYLKLIDGLGLMSNMALARHYWYSVKLEAHISALEIRRPARFLEVGAGGGQFAMLMSNLGLVGHYVIADLPEMLLNSALTLSQRYPESKVHFGKTPAFKATGLNFWLLDTDDIEKIPDGSIDVSLNFNSFMEMDEQVRDFYIENIYRCSRPGAIFYNVNRRQSAMSRRGGEIFDNHPLLYPYRPSDRVVEWGPDQMQQDNRSRRFQSPHKSFCISRIAQVA